MSYKWCSPWNDAKVSIHYLASRIVNCVAIWSIITQSFKKESHLLSNHLDSTFWYLPLKTHHPNNPSVKNIAWWAIVSFLYDTSMSLKFDWQYYIFSQRTFFVLVCFIDLGLLSFIVAWSLSIVSCTTFPEVHYLRN